MEGSARQDVPHWVLDALLAVAVACGIALIIATDQGGERRPDLLAYLFAAGLGALMLLRRRFPRMMVVLAVAAIFGYYILDYPPIGMAVPIVAALYAAADAGRTLWAIGAGVLVLLVALYFRVRGGEPLGLLVGYETVSNLALMGMAVLLGVSVRAHRARREQQETIDRLSAAHAQAQARLAMQTEREQLSRDLHDTVGHAMSVISLQAGVASEAIGVDDRAAADAVGRIRDASRQTLTEVRSLVRVLRAGEDATLAGVHRLVESVRGAGIDVVTDLPAAEAGLPVEVQATAYRVIQEALTNVVRHSGADATTITAVTRPVGSGGKLVVTVADNGRGVSDDRGGEPPGQGLIGMRERVLMIGGTLTVGNDDHQGFRVVAEIPLPSGGAWT